MTSGGPNDPNNPGVSGGQFPQAGQIPTQGYGNPVDYGTQPGPSYPGPAAPGGYGGYPSAPPMPPAPGGVSQQAAGFFPALFDFNFDSYVTPKVVKVLYILVTAMMGLGLLVMVVSAFSEEPVAGLLALVFGSLGFIVFLALIRISLEFYVAVIKISEDVKELKRR
ncbi:protein of unknown function [Rhodococcus tukisamuensis]|uniref:DUF4282 domain-containing protein n=1 Tax=Rhodococcus tukisamuensis TaxID=168276 RepID=A0A1G6MRI4_9NOCA|nr:protein of unknown function [Rhodococcus tukisamuensis]